MKHDKCLFSAVFFFFLCFSCTRNAPIPKLSTNQVTSITSNTVVSGGNIVDDGGETIKARGVVWSTKPNPTITLTTKTNDGTGMGAFVSNVSGLSSNTTYYIRAYATSINGTAYGNEINFKTNESIAGSVVIGSQIWMNRNLEVINYRNGDPIPQVSDPSQWANLKTGAWCYYNNDSTLGIVYGKLYNWYAVNDPRGLAPAGWHIPTDEEWSKMINHLGGESIAGMKMKVSGTEYWAGRNDGFVNNVSGFSGLPGGFRGDGGSFSYMRDHGFWWSITENPPTDAWCRILSFGSYSAKRSHYAKYFGFSIRCVKN